MKEAVEKGFEIMDRNFLGIQFFPVVSIVLKSRSQKGEKKKFTSFCNPVPTTVNTPGTVFEKQQMTMTQLHSMICTWFD